MFDKKILIIFCFSFLTGIVFGHPHLFIKPSIEIVSNENIIKGIKLIWEWDNWWSEDVINACDTNKNGIFGDDEVKLVYKNFFSGVKDFNYFTEIFINGEKLKIISISDFNAYIDKDYIVIYEFSIPIELKLENTLKIKIRFNDETIYTAFEKNINLIKNNNYKFTNLSIADYSYYGVQLSFNVSRN